MADRDPRRTAYLKRTLAAACLLGLCLLAGACGRQEPAADEPPALKDAEPVHLAYVEWSTEVASTHLVKAFFQERLGVRCRVIAMTPERMWAAVANGEADGMVSAWLPRTHESYFARYGDEVVDLGPNLQGTRIGLVVPEVRVGRQTGPEGRRTTPLVDIESIPELRGQAGRFGNVIIGIDPQAGIMMRTEQAMEAYGLNDRFELVQGNEARMVEALVEAIRAQRWVVVTGWEPHWLFGRYNLRFLEDPQNVFGQREAIHTLVRKGLKEERPLVYAALDNFQWNRQQMSQLMSWIQRDERLFPCRNAVRWLEENPETVDSWMPEGNR